ncbi:nucleotide sugar dehydrogenase [Halalkalicoccus jeotgali]|uniref:UDP-N-acetyl-D-mannosamine dehydrogenase n=1 Tax=Halalkalicoccus jeotgali (strain DSM 18796 / CECT 7217 / JCM 14584 / KCTC 4019 / B3) TaxID=795797 RepID=D8J5R9_HALJB|nr:nucleotide sugar dehydrogenase [Halalkalicoccus jeotgali]ADJ13725.1 nucleotide sugar dehydrogenase [Halalkalicoccus jeotgali B3]ELY34228.1 nucleotide sugar dehydrogenase [Halalkalicoccus jeotgali B3]
MSNTARSAPALYDSAASTDEQRTALTSGEIPVAVYGLGKMGLPLASVYADVTGNVTGMDVDPEVVEGVNAGENHIVGEPGLSELVSEVVDRGALSATTDGSTAASEARIHVVIVPTLVDENSNPDLSVVESVMEQIASGLKAGDQVILESTVPPRTCRDVVAPLLAAESGLDREEFGVAFCPERTASGRAIEDIRGAYPKIVGGIDDESTRVAELIYGEINSQEIIPVSDATTAEAVKVFEGVYRDVNIALANELTKHAEELEISVLEAIQAANTQPFCDLHIPGAGVGGHCIPYYPHFLIQMFDADSRLMELSREINDTMPAYTAELALSGLTKHGKETEGSDVLVLGLTYRAGVDELRATPAMGVIERLAGAGANVTAVDPITDTTELFENAGAAVVSLEDARERTYDAVVLVTAQEAFEDLEIPALAADDPLVVVDGRQALSQLQNEHGIYYRGIGINA